MMTQDQLRGSFDRVLLGAIMFGLGTLDVGYFMASFISGGAMLVLGGVYGWWVNRPTAIKQSAIDLGNTLVVEIQPAPFMRAVNAVESLASVLDVRKVIAPPNIAKAAPNSKVTSK